MMTKTKTLFDLSTEAVELDDLLNDFDGDITDEAKEAEIDRFLTDAAENRDSLKSKIDGYIAIIAENDARSEMRQAEAARIARLANENKLTSDRLKSRLIFAMQNILHVEKLETDFHLLKTQKSGGKQSLKLLTDISNEDFVTRPENERFTKIIPPVAAKTVVDNEKIRAALEAGETLEFAELAERKTLLKIK